MSENQPIIVVKDLYKSFKLPHEQHSGLKQLIVNFAKRKKGYEVQDVLDNISFEVNEGDFFGIVGRNGSGKSTLLKLLAGIYVPDKGLIQVNGSITPFIELGVGFNPELTGRENIYMNGAMLGFSHKEMEAMYDGIVEFAELEKFMDQKLKNYSSGMQVRLAFSIAIRAQGDILIIDEVLAVGDAAFQQKCFDYFEQLKREKRTIIIVTHDMGAVQRFCNRALMISDGVIEAMGDPKDIANVYKRENIEQEQGSDKKEEKVLITAHLISEKVLNRSDSIRFKIEYSLLKEVDHYLGISFTFNGISVAERNSKDIAVPKKINGKYVIYFEQSLNNFNSGSYDIGVAVFNKDTGGLIDYNVRATSFVIEGYDERFGGPMYIDGTWATERFLKK